MSILEKSFTTETQRDTASTQKKAFPFFSHHLLSLCLRVSVVYFALPFSLSQRFRFVRGYFLTIRRTYVWVLDICNLRFDALFSFYICPVFKRRRLRGK